MVRPSIFRLTPLAVFIILFLVSSLLGQWQPDKRLTLNGVLPQGDARVASDLSGVVHLVYASDKIYYKRSTDSGDKWESAIPLNNDTGMSDVPSIALAGSNVYVVWCNQSNFPSLGGEYWMYFKRSTDRGVTWERSIRLTNDNSPKGSPIIAASDLNVYVIWDNYGDEGGCYYKSSTDGGVSWSENTRFGRVSDIALMGTTVHVAERGIRGIYYKRSTDLGVTWSSGILIDSSFQTVPIIAVFDSCVHIFWPDFRKGDKSMEIYYTRSTDSGVTWSPNVRLTDDKFMSAFPSVVVFGKNVHLVWMNERRIPVRYGVDDEEKKRTIYYKHSTDGGTNWSQGERLTSLSPRSEGAEGPCIVVCGSTVLGVWREDRTGKTEIYYKRNITGK